MKRIALLAICIACLSLTGNAQFKFGAGVQFFDSSFGIQGKAHNTFSEDFAGQGTFSYYFESGATIWGVDLDVHYSGFDIGDLESFSVTPFAGLNYFRASVFGIGASRTGLNLGVNGSMPLGNLTLYIEPKITIASNSAFGISGGIYF